ncbi:hypothetical protein UFOVP724_153 [uncultured Caudovirales phage]|uniref:Uncharacterized protein n=1 Tax=uncultured Caudovirales phage TaxID=2100421 RepID=A0A6J5NRQ6_9CAUD|nr:hypothetical protein UFOVP724_153 [uncultured Caudovirales phage]
MPYSLDTEIESIIANPGSVASSNLFTVFNLLLNKSEFKTIVLSQVQNALNSYYSSNDNNSLQNLIQNTITSQPVLTSFGNIVDTKITSNQMITGIKTATDKIDFNPPNSSYEKGLKQLMSDLSNQVSLCATNTSVVSVQSAVNTILTDTASIKNQNNTIISNINTSKLDLTTAIEGISISVTLGSLELSIADEQTFINNINAHSDILKDQIIAAIPSLTPVTTGITDLSTLCSGRFDSLDTSISNIDTIDLSTFTTKTDSIDAQLSILSLANNTILSTVNDLKKYNYGNWKIEDQQLVITYDNVEIIRFNLLDTQGNPTIDEIRERSVVVNA